MGAAITGIRPASAQDAHYWSVESGARATLLGGTVVAGVDDLSAAFYNPAGLVRATRASVMSTFVKTVTDVELDTRASGGTLATSSMGASAPGFFAARIPLHLTEGDAISFSFSVRTSSELDLGGDLSSQPPSGGVEERDLFIFKDVYDGWYGLSWAAAPGPVSFGLSLFLSSVSHRQRIQTTAVRVGGAEGDYVATDDLDFDFAVKRIVAKFGALWDPEPLKLGMTVTLPSVRLPASSGSVSAGRGVVAEGSAAIDELAATRQQGLRADLRRPLSVAIGGELALGGLDLNAAAEWFGAVDPYDVLATDPFMTGSPRAEATLPMRQGRRDVLNLGVGVSVNTAAGFSLFASARSDHSFVTEPEDTFVGIDAYDLIHLTGGIGLSREQLDLWLGLLHGAGDVRRGFRASPLDTAGDIDAVMTFRRIGFVVAVSASF